ncbi:MAG: ATP-binding protein [Myxococcota bacterium]|nr:ATP-binding protein [Myxococcota bacterium]
MTPETKSPLLSLLREPTTAIAYALAVRVRSDRPGKHVLETDSALFDPRSHAAAGHAQLELRPDVIDHWNHSWPSGDGGTVGHLRAGWSDVRWGAHRLELVTLEIRTGFAGPPVQHAIVADDRATAQAYFEAVCAHCAEIRDEILVYANGCWNKSQELFAAVRSTTWEQLVLADGMAEHVRADFDRFVAAREQYERWGIPWKRGAILIGPPGNGKTMCIKALIRHLALPCLYVQSFVAPRVPEQVCIRDVFDRARRTAPCVMVLEDIDSLVTPTSRSFFLNELDGFASNTGLITIASTNHPDRLDPAIVDRPSRFDRKYHFELPAEPERHRYIALWSARLSPELRPDDATLSSLAAATESFSFAYLKELFASALMRFASDGPSDGGGVARALSEEVVVLRAQMQTHAIVPEVGAGAVPEGGDPWQMQMRHRGRF